MQWQEIVADSLASQLKRHIGNIGGRKLGAEIVELAQSLYVGNGLDIENQYGYHAGRISNICWFEVRQNSWASALGFDCEEIIVQAPHLGRNVMLFRCKRFPPVSTDQAGKTPVER